jgi:dihydroorotase
MLDLIVKGGRVIDPANGVDGVMDVGFADGKVARVAASIADSAKETRDATGMIVTPGLIDLHTHVYWGGTSISVDATQIARQSGTTTLVDAGSAGPGNFAGFRRHVIEPSPVRILAYLNISFPGIFAYSKTVMVGECGDIRLLDPVECVRTINDHRDLIVGVKARVGKIAGGSSGAMPLDLALEAAAETGLPVMAHLDNPPPSRIEVLSRLRCGDILTHCFKPFPNAPIRFDGEIWEEVVMARERGVIFDIGHGMMSFGFKVARGMLDKGFVPDVISSDVHMFNINGPVFDLLVTLSKFLCLGVDLPTLVRTVTSAPAAAVRRQDLGHLGAGAAGDATILRIEDGSFEYRDCLGEPLTGKNRIALHGIVSGGRWGID